MTRDEIAAGCYTVFSQGMTATWEDLPDWRRERWRWVADFVCQMLPTPETVVVLPDPPPPPPPAPRPAVSRPAKPHTARPAVTPAPGPPLAWLESQAPRTGVASLRERMKARRQAG